MKVELKIFKPTPAVLIAPPPEAALLLMNRELIIIALPGFMSIAPPQYVATLFSKVQSIITESDLMTKAAPLSPLAFLSVNDERMTFEFKVKIE